MISGSLPKGCSDSTYQKLCEIAHENGAKVFMDTSFKLLEPALCEKPEIIKISSYDLARYNHIDAQLKEEEIKTMGKQFLNQYCDYLCVSTENNGIYLLTKDKTYHCAALDLKIKSRVGVGDAFVAGFVVGLDVKTNDSDALRLAGACYAAASQRINAHPKSYYEISSYLDEIQIYEI